MLRAEWAADSGMSQIYGQTKGRAPQNAAFAIVQSLDLLGLLLDLHGLPLHFLKGFEDTCVDDC